MAKTRVVPLKKLILPKLELMATLIGASFIMDTIRLSPSAIHLWTDSQIVLYWLQSEKRLNQFVSHRVTEILQLTTTAAWRCRQPCRPVNQGNHGSTVTVIPTLASMVTISSSPHASKLSNYLSHTTWTAPDYRPITL